MPDLQDGQSVEIQGSARLPYILKNIGGVYSCSCPAWRNQSLPIERRTCKHLRQFRGEQAEQARVGGAPARRQAFKHDPPRPQNYCWPKPGTPRLTLPAGGSAKNSTACVRCGMAGSFCRGKATSFMLRPGSPPRCRTISLDGELWLARKAFQRTVSIVRRHDGQRLGEKFASWCSMLRPSPSRSRSGWLTLRDLLRRSPARLCRASRTRALPRCGAICTRNWIASALWGAKDSCSVSRVRGTKSGRSATLLKVKRFHDAEGRVVAHLPGTGRHRAGWEPCSWNCPTARRFPSAPALPMPSESIRRRSAA